MFSYFPTTINRMVSPRSAQLRIHIFHFLSGKILFWRGEGGFCLFLSETIIACSTTKKMCVVVVVVVCYSALGSVVQLALIFFMGTANKFSFFLSCLVERRVIASRLISGGMRRAGQHVDMTHREKEPTLSDAGPSLFSFFFKFFACVSSLSGNNNNNRKWNCINIRLPYSSQPIGDGGHLLLDGRV